MWRVSCYLSKTSFYKSYEEVADCTKKGNMIYIRGIPDTVHLGVTPLKIVKKISSEFLIKQLQNKTQDKV